MGNLPTDGRQDSSDLQPRAFPILVFRVSLFVPVLLGP